VGLLEFCVREHLNRVAMRRMVIFDPLKIIITNFEAGEEWLESENNPEDPATGNRKIPFSRELYIEREDFMENPPKKYFRLSPGQMVRLKSAFIIRCDEVTRDANGQVTELHCTYLPESKSGSDTSGIHVKGTLHWVSIAHAAPVSLKLYDRLFKVEDVANAEGDFKDHINEHSLDMIETAYAEPALLTDAADTRYQFVRKGYFVRDRDDNNGKPVFNRTVTLKDSWAKEVKKQ
jgi:glutaminyl-tRNA synthetase